MHRKPHATSLLQYVLLACTLALTAPLAQAQDAPAEAAIETSTVWQCSYANGTIIYCRVAVAQIDENPLPEASALPLEPSPSYYPTKGPLPALVSDIHTRPARLLDRTIAIPMFSPAENMEIARELADAVVCDAQISCRIEFIASTNLGSAIILPPAEIATR